MNFTHENGEKFGVKVQHFLTGKFKIKLEGFRAMRTNKDTIKVQGSLGKVLSGKHPNLQDLGKLLLL